MAHAEIQMRLLTVFREHSIELWDFTQRHDYKSAHGKFSLQVLGAASELEVSLTAERIRETKRGKAQKGKPGGGPHRTDTPRSRAGWPKLKAYGYGADEAYAKACTDYPIGKRWYVDEKKAEVVRLIFALYSAPEHRLGTKRLARHLNERGHRTRNGLAWLSNFVRRLIANPAYAGFTSFDESAYQQRTPSATPRDRQTLFPGEHEALIDADVWKKCQTLKAEAVVTRRGTVGKGRVFLLTGLLKCPACGSRMVGKWTAHSERSYYLCARRHNGGPDLCEFPLLDANQLHDEARPQPPRGLRPYARSNLTLKRPR